MLRCWVAILAVLFAQTAGAEAAELEGFGPIKFGMSKDEALSVIERKGLWSSRENTLTYDYRFPDWGLNFDVTQYFTEGRASRATARYLLKPLDRKVCLQIADRIAAMTEVKYGIAPIVRFISWEALRLSVVSIFYTFGFESGAVLQIVTASHLDPDDCRAEANYYPPPRNSLPF